MTLHGDQVFQLGGVPVASDYLLPANVYLVAKEEADKESFLWWSKKWKKEKFFTDIPTAYAKAVAGRNDVIMLVPDFDDNIAATLTWAKNDTHFIGASVNPFQPHTDIWMQDLTTFDPMVEVSARGCYFANLTFRHGSHVGSQVGYATDLTCMTISGRYNTFDNVYFYTPLYAEQDVVSTYKGVQVTGHNNYFRKCKFGSDGLERDKVNWNLVVAGVGNVFDECIFQMCIGNTSSQFVWINNVVRDMKHVLFRRCTFYAHSPGYANKVATAFKTDFQGGNTTGVILEDCNFVNVTAVCSAAQDGNVHKTSPGDAAATAYTGLAVPNVGA